MFKIFCPSNSKQILEFKSDLLYNHPNADWGWSFFFPIHLDIKVCRINLVCVWKMECIYPSSEMYCRRIFKLSSRYLHKPYCVLMLHWSLSQAVFERYPLLTSKKSGAMEMCAVFCLTVRR